MTLDVLADLSWFAIVVAALAHYVLGAIWFTPLFGRAWDTAIGHDRQADPAFSPAYYLVPLASSVLVAVAMAVVLGVARLEALADALGLGLVVGVGLALAISVNNALTPHTPHPFRHGFITGGYQLVGVVLVTAVVTLLTG